MVEGNPRRILFKEIEKKCWIFLIACATITTILGNIKAGLGIAAGAILILYNFKYLYLNLEKLFDRAALGGKVKRTGSYYFARLLAVALLVYLALVVFELSAWGLVAGMVLAISVMIYYSVYLVL